MRLGLWRFYGAHSGTSWRLTIAEQRREIPDVLNESPSLKRLRPEFMGDAYKKARRMAIDETVSRNYQPVTFDEDGGTVTNDFAVAVSAYNAIVEAIRSAENYYK